MTDEKRQSDLAALIAYSGAATHLGLGRHIHHGRITVFAQCELRDHLCGGNTSVERRLPPRLGLPQRRRQTARSRLLPRRFERL